MNSSLSFVQRELAKIEKEGLYRSCQVIDSEQDSRVRIDGKEYILLCSNNYLGLATHPEVKKSSIEAVKRFGAGSGASRLVSGTSSLHVELERRLAEFKRCASCILFTSGYMANVGTITSIVGREDLVVIDRLNHASIVDGCRASGATLRVFPHRDTTSLEKILKRSGRFKKRLIITDGIFSMDGDIAPLPEIMRLAKKYEAIVMVDDAHGTGVLGKDGRGVIEHFNLEGVDILIGTCSKALGSLGGFVVGSASLVEFLRNKARSFIYSTAISPAAVGATLGALNVVEREPYRRKKLWGNVAYLRKGLLRLGFDLGGSETQILPIIFGGEEETMKVASYLFRKGIIAIGIRPPTVPKGTSRIRLSVMATHTKEDLDYVLSTFQKL
jgi:8-amino-7-oxononanoate synthase